MNYLANVIKSLPNNLQELIFDLSANGLGLNPMNMKQFGDAIKYIPNNLQNFTLNLHSN